MDTPLGRLVKNLRNAQGWNQDQLASASDVSRRQIQKIETGEISTATQTTLRKLADALGGHYEELLVAAEGPIDPAKRERLVDTLRGVSVGIGSALLRPIDDLRTLPVNIPASLEQDMTILKLAARRVLEFSMYDISFIQYITDSIIAKYPYNEWNNNPLVSHLLALAHLVEGISYDEYTPKHADHGWHHLARAKQLAETIEDREIMYLAHWWELHRIRKHADITGELEDQARAVRGFEDLLGHGGLTISQRLGAFAELEKAAIATHNWDLFSGVHNAGQSEMKKFGTCYFSTKSI